jgi:hypothetical protein
MGVETLPSAHPADHSHLKKNQRDCKASSHPLPMLVNLPFENEDHRNTGSNHPQRGVRSCGDTLLQTAIPYETGTLNEGGSEPLLGAGNLYPAYARGLAYLVAHQGREAAVEFQKILNHRGVAVADPIGALAHLQLGRAYAMSGDKIKARSAYQDFLMLWKHADLDIPVYQQAKAEYEKLQ